MSRIFHAFYRRRYKRVYTNFFDTEVTSTVQLVAVENGAPILDEETSTSRCFRYSLLSSSIFLLHIESFEVEEAIMVGSSAIYRKFRATMKI